MNDLTGPGKESLQRPAFYALVLLAVWVTYLVVGPFLVSLTWAAVFAILFHETQTFLSPKIGPNRAALVSTLMVFVLIVGPAVFLVATLARELPEVAAYVQEASLTAPRQIEGVWEMVRPRIPIALPEDPTQLLREGAQRLFSFMAPRAGAVVSDIFATLGHLIAMLFALYFMLRDGDKIGRELRYLLPLPSNASDRLISDTRDLVVASVGAGLIVAVTQGAIGGIAFWLLGLTAPVLWAVVIAFTSLIPVVGAALIWLPAAIWLLLSGEIGRGVILIVVGSVGIGLADNVLRPLLLSGRTSVHGLVIFFGLLGGISAFGFIGIVLGPIILVVTARLLKLFARPDLANEPIVLSAPDV
jgi:predicted PurR-regulated permease PerM